MRKTYAVFGWNIPRLNEQVSALEAEGHIVRGHELGRLAGYDFFESDFVVFLEYTPEALDHWKALGGDKFQAQVIMPKAPPAYGETEESAKPEPKARTTSKRAQKMAESE